MFFFEAAKAIEELEHQIRRGLIRTWVIIALLLLADLGVIVLGLGSHVLR